MGCHVCVLQHTFYYRRGVVVSTHCIVTRMRCALAGGGELDTGGRYIQEIRK